MGQILKPTSVLKARPIDRILQILGDSIDRKNGAKAHLARELGISPQAVQKICASGRIPASRCRQISDLVDGLVSVHEMRPDVFGDPVSDLAGLDFGNAAEQHQQGN